MTSANVVLRPAVTPDADNIAKVMRASLDSLPWMPLLHTPEADRGFVRSHLLPNQTVTVAEAEGRIVGFIAVEGEWIEQLYLDPDWTGRGIGSRLLALAAANMPVSRLHCFQANDGARRF